MDLAFFAMCLAYGGVAFVSARAFAVPADRALTAGAWNALLTLVTLGPLLALTAVGCAIGENLSEEALETCRALEDGAVRAWGVLATPLVSTALVVAATRARAAGRAAWPWAVMAIVAALAVPGIYLEGPPPSDFYDLW